MPRLIAVLALLAAASAQAQSLPAEARAVLGDWTSYGDEGREPQAVIRLTSDGGELRGQIPVRPMHTANRFAGTTSDENLATGVHAEVYHR